MHELSLAENIIQIIETASVTQQFGQVKVVCLEIGSLFGVETDALRFCFDAVARNTVAQQARLEITMIPASGTCLDCGSIHAVTTLLDFCPRCGSYTVQVTGGSGMWIKELEVI